MLGPGPGWASLIVLFYLALIGLSIYGMVLFIRLAHRGIKALDIYIDNNQREK